MPRSHHLLILILFLLLLSPCRAQSPAAALEAHRQWMAASYPRPDTLRQPELLKQAALAISWGLREPQAAALLEAATPAVPQLADYLRWLRSDRPDTLFRHSTAALNAIALAAEKALGPHHTATAWCRYLAISTESSTRNVTPRAQKALRDQEKAVSQNPTREAKAILLMMRLSLVQYSLFDEILTNPAHFPQLLQAEREALKLYNPADTAPSLTHAYLLIELARAKSYMASSESAEQAEQEAGWLEAPTYRLLTNGTRSNAPYYLERACHMLRALFTEGHPLFVNACVMEADFLEQNTPPFADWTAAREAQQLYYELYLPEGSPERVFARISTWETKMAAAAPNNDVFFFQKVAEQLKTIYPQDTPYFLNMLSRVLSVAGCYLPQSAIEATDSFDTLVETQFASQPIKKALYLNGLYFSIKDYMAQKAEQKLQEALETYLAHHSPDHISVALGYAISYNNALYNFNYATALQAENCLCQDLADLYGPDSPTTLQEEAFHLKLMESVDREKPRQLFQPLIDRMKKNGMDHRDVLGMYADYEYNYPNYPKAEQLYRQLINEETDDIPAAKKATNRLALSTAILANQGSEKEREKLFQQACKLMDSDNDTLNINVTNYRMAADYLLEKGRYEEALQTIDKGIAWNELQKGGNGELDDQLTSLLVMKNDLLYNKLNNKVEAKRQMTQQLAQYHPDTQVHYTTSTLDYLWGCYNILTRDNGNDFTQSNIFFNLITSITQNIYRQSGESKAFLMSYGVKALSALVDYLVKGRLYFNQMPEGELPQNLDEKALQAFQEMKNVKDSLPSITNSFIAQLKQIETDFPAYDADYMRNGYYSSVIQSLCSCYRYLNPDYDEAARYMQKNCELQADIPFNSFYAWLNLATFHIDNKKYAQAAEALTKAEKFFKKAQGTTINDQLNLANTQCDLCYFTADYDHMLQPARTSFACMREILDGNFQLMTEQEQENFMQAHQAPAASLIFMLSKQPQNVAAEAYDAVLYRTGMQLRSQGETKNAILRSADKQLIALVDSLNALRQKKDELDIFYLLQQQGQAQQSALSFAISRLEQQILKASEPYRSQNASSATWQQVRDKLGDKEAAIEFVFSDHDIMALVVRKDSKAPIPVFLTKSDTLARRIAGLGETRSEKIAKLLYDNPSNGLYQLLWKPLETYLEGATTIFYSTPGVLNNLAFAAFTTPDGAYLFDRYDLCQLTTTASLLRQPDNEKPTSAMLMGDIFYSPRQSTRAAQGAYTRGADDDDDDSRSFDDFSDSNDERGASREHFAYLRFTAGELQSIEEKMKANGMEPSKIKTEKQLSATENAFRQLAQEQPSILHLATHGFFIADADKAYDIPFYKKHTQFVTNSMRRAGVALAGAEASWCGAEAPETSDGIITAQEVSRLNLQKTKLVTLSACETALGDCTFEGIYGLPRGFKQAGARSLLVSLWSVNDKSASILMTAFYNRWLAGTPMRQALRQAVEEVRAQFPSPYYWAPFVLLDAN